MRETSSKDSAKKQLVPSTILLGRSSWDITTKKRKMKSMSDKSMRKSNMETNISVQLQDLLLLHWLIDAG